MLVIQMVIDYFLQNYSTKEAKEKIVKYYQLLVMHEFFDSNFRSDLVLKNLSAGYFAYGVSEGSSTLEFITLSKIKIEEVKAFIKKITHKYSNIKIASIVEKRYSNLIYLEVSIKNEVQEIVIDITKIVYDWKRGKNYDVRILEVDFWNMKVVGQVVNLNDIIRENPDLEVFKNIKFNL